MPDTPEKIDLASADIKKLQLEKLKTLFPEAVTEGKIDFDRLKLTLGEQIENAKERYGMSWAGKSGCFRIIQEPSVGTLKPAREESVDFDTTQNIFIEGDNLEVLKLLQKSYYEKVKMIYIDPPYNTGQDFVYSDKFGQQLDEYLKLTNQVDTEGRKFATNTDTDGRKHSKWVNMIYPRLFLARNLLSEDGIIFISIDDNEVDNLKKTCDEIFGEENFIATFVWQKRVTRENRSVISVNHEYIVCYAKSSEFVKEAVNLLPMSEEAIGRYKNPDNDPRGDWTSVPAIAQAGHGTKNQFYTLTTPSGREITPPSGSCWRYTSQKMTEEISKKNIWFGSDGNGVPRIKKFITNGKQGLTPISILQGKEIGTTDSAKRELVELFEGVSVFETPKPTSLIEHLINIGVQSDDIILDFFSGTCPTAHAVLRLNHEDGGNRRFIVAQLPEPLEQSITLTNGTVLSTIADIGRERVRRVINNIKKEPSQQKKLDSNSEIQDLGFKTFRLDRSNFKLWNKSAQDIQTALSEHVEQIKSAAKPEDVLYEILLKDGFELTLPINEIKLADKNIYSIENNQLLICLEDNLTPEVFKELKKLNPYRVVVLDKGFNNNDQLKTNAVQTLGKNDAEEFILRSV